MANKTQPTNESVARFIESIENDTRREDSRVLLKMMREVTRAKPVMWGPILIGFGQYHYKYDSGHEGDCFMVGFSPGKQSLSVHVMPGFARYDSLMKKLGKYKTGASCLYINKLADVHLDVLKQLIKESYEHMKKEYHG